MKPWMADCDIAYLDALFAERPDMRVFEWGSGWSTVRWATPQWVTCDSKAKWTWLARDFSMAGKVLHKPHRPSYIEAPRWCDGPPFDLFIVDGKWRMACVNTALRLMRPGDLCLLHDEKKYGGRHPAPNTVVVPATGRRGHFGWRLFEGRDHVGEA